MRPYETLVLWVVFFVCAAGVAAGPIAFRDLWAKRLFKIAYFIVLAFLVGIALAGNPGKTVDRFLDVAL
jgi:hypothetical protein